MVSQAAQQFQFSTRRPDGCRQPESKGSLVTVSVLYYDVGFGYGVYEWQASKVENCNETKLVLDIGGTCNVHPESSLRDSVKEYRTKGSHATALINDALTMEYESWFRIQNVPDRQFTEDQDNEPLDRYRIECETQWLM